MGVYAPRAHTVFQHPRRLSDVVVRPLNFTVRFLRNRFRKPVARRGLCSYNNLWPRTRTPRAVL
jgi:hypothetical protein